MERTIAFALSVLWLWPTAAGWAAPARKSRPKHLNMIATAHSKGGTTAAGTRSRAGTAAADPAVLPLGTRIRIRGKHGKLREYLITDTGPTGRHIDLYVPKPRDARKFGKRHVRVEILEWGEGKSHARAADRADRVEGRSDQPKAGMVK